MRIQLPRLASNAVAFFFASALLVGCSATNVTPSQMPQQLMPAGAARSLSGKSCRIAACIYVANGDDRVTVYAAQANGNVKPTRTISGSNTDLVSPAGIAVDAGKNMYVTNFLNPGEYFVTVYAAGARGNAAPIRTIRGSNTGLYGPTGIALDSTGATYVVNALVAHWAVNVYAAGANGNVAPIRTISGGSTGLVWSSGVALDTNAEVYVTSDYGCDRGRCSGTDQVTVYAAGADGNVAPIRTISGSATKLMSPSGIALDANNNIYVVSGTFTDRGGTLDSINVYAAGANGNVAPIRTITGPNTRLKNPDGVAVGADGTTYVANFGTVEHGSEENPKITVYAAGANGNVAPIRTIHGTATMLGGPKIAVH